MRVTTYAIKPDRTAEDRRYLQMAIDESRKCTPSTSSYCVGAVIVTTNRKIFTGYTHETSPTHHAEQEAILKRLQRVSNCGGDHLFFDGTVLRTKK